MTNKLDYIVSLLRKEFTPHQIRLKGIDITVILKERVKINSSVKINFSVLDNEVLIYPDSGVQYFFRSKSNNVLLRSAIERIKTVFLAEQINCTVLQVLGSSNK